MTPDYQCFTKGAVASSRLLEFPPPPDPVYSGKMIVKFPPDSKFRRWPRDMDMQMCL